MTFALLRAPRAFHQRRGKKPDRNHAEVRDGLKRIPGMVVRDTTQTGGPLDLLCAYRGRLRFLEVKDGELPPSRHKLTNKEAEFIAAFPDWCAVVTSLREAMAVMGIEVGDSTEDAIRLAAGQAEGRNGK